MRKFLEVIPVVSYNNTYDFITKNGNKVISGWVLDDTTVDHLFTEEYIKGIKGEIPIASEQIYIQTVERTVSLPDIVELARQGYNANDIIKLRETGII